MNMIEIAQTMSAMAALTLILLGSMSLKKYLKSLAIK